MRSLTWIPIALVSVLLLGACSPSMKAIKSGIQNDVAFNEVVLEDVQQAKLLAQRTNDMLAVKCWSYLEKFTITNAPDSETVAGKVVGVFSAYQKARNVRRTVVEVEISDQFRLECGPMLTDSMGALGRLGIRLVL